MRCTDVVRELDLQLIKKTIIQNHQKAKEQYYRIFLLKGHYHYSQMSN
jgi:hypothetical protein